MVFGNISQLIRLSFLRRQEALRKKCQPMQNFAFVGMMGKSPHPNLPPRGKA